MDWAWSCRWWVRGCIVTARAVGVVPRLPILSVRGEDIGGDHIVQSLGGMRHVRRNAQHFARTDDLLFAIQDEAQPAFLSHRDLLVVMAVLGHDVALAHPEARDGNLIAVDALPREQRVQPFLLDGR